MVRESDQFDQLLLLIGRLNYSWSNTESLLIHLIAGLARTDKDTALIVFLTLNTSRARLDLVERLAKLERTARQERHDVLDITARFGKLSGLRNRYNHSLFAFDPESGAARTIMMRISDRKENLKMGQEQMIDAEALDELRRALTELSDLNKAVWSFVRTYSYPA
ncbi:hypothetical protein EEB11_18765 [Pseudotabrizicola sediminis]|uniref:Uncharacterized protein n=1 Tax=Pseudotabrizicola sediminis TaxID=2486418 RepID=A0ABY2KGQ4_9RHOB|nr:hypothetical protein [Pseudotabrizicola sediminis]TGD41378.1 hypothetical protein EEB11_18765 [Pseudotabrizicola sediminis]TGD61057.1 hypothetical protein EYC08_19510 [Tabrizicola sp. WMC-M-20]